MHVVSRQFRPPCCLSHQDAGGQDEVKEYQQQAQQRRYISTPARKYRARRRYLAPCILGLGLQAAGVPLDPQQRKHK